MMAKKVKHILFLTHYFPPEVNAPASRTYEHAKRWVKKDVRVTVITNNPNHPNGKLFPGYINNFFSQEQVDGINILRVKTYLVPNAGLVRRIINYIFYFCMACLAALKVGKVDVVVATSPQFFCGLAGAFIKKMKRAPFILEIRDLWPESIIVLGIISNNFIIKVLKTIEKLMYNSADHLITTTSSIKKFIEDMGYHDSKITTIENGADLSLFSKNVKREYSKIKINGKFILSYFGTFGLAHGIDVILHTAKLLEEYKDIEFLLVGDGADRNNTLQLSKDYNLKNVVFMPLQPKSTVVELLSQTTVGLVTLKDIPLFKTAIPSKIFEFMAMKVPIIMATGQIEGSRIIEKYDCGLITDSENALLLKNSILSLYDNANLRREMGNNGFLAVTNHYNRDKLAQKMLKIITTNFNT